MLLSGTTVTDSLTVGFIVSWRKAQLSIEFRSAMGLCTAMRSTRVKIIVEKL